MVDIKTLLPELRELVGELAEDSVRLADKLLQKLDKI